MIGIDMTKISRFKNKVYKERFIKRILHPEEIKQFKLSNNKAHFLAAHWAIKEAMFKIDNQRFHFDKILISKQNRAFNVPGYKISTSQEHDFYIAIAQKI